MLEHGWGWHFRNYSRDFMVGEGHAVGSLNTFVCAIIVCYHCALLCYYSTTMCYHYALLYACALLLCYHYALPVCSTTLVFYRLPSALYDCVCLALSQPFLYSFLPIAVAFLYWSQPTVFCPLYLLWLFRSCQRPLRLASPCCLNDAICCLLPL